MNMYVAINGTGNSKSIYIMSSYRKNNGKTSSRIFRKLGRLNDLLPQFDNNEEKLLEWARSEAKKDTLSHQQDTAPVLIPFSSDKKIKKSKKMKFCYLMLATYSFNPSVPIFILTIFVVILRIIINSNMISIASSAILSTLVFYILPVNALLSLSLILCWNSQSINYRISIVPYLYWPRNLITYRRKFIEIPTSFIKE